MINYVVSDLIETSKGLIDSVNPDDINAVRKCGKSLIKMSEATEGMHKALKKFLRDNLYQHKRVKGMADQAKETVSYLYNAYMTRPELLTNEIQEIINGNDENKDDLTVARVIADYIAGMTDRFAFSEYERISGK